MTRTPTDEQQHAIEVVRTGENVVIEALAGTGKTSTLEMIAEDRPDKRMQYVAFNKSIVTEASGRFPTNVVCSTAHSLAFREVGKDYSKRLKAPRMKAQELANILGLPEFTCEIRGTRKRLAPGFLAGVVKRSIAVFTQTGDPEPTTAHMPMQPIDEPDVGPDGKLINRWGPNNRALALMLEPFMRKWWRDVESQGGRLPFTHGDYLKLWQLREPRIHADAILYDEAQDANGCMLAIVNAQEHAQLVFVGDTYQQIYGWNGAINALTKADPTAPRARLTESFRFGPDIAEKANVALRWLEAPVTLKGRGTQGTVGPMSLDEADAVLFRTNAKAVALALQEIRAGHRVALVGGAEDVISFAKAADELKQRGRCYHPELQCFDSWGEVQDYVEHDPSGSDLKVLVQLVDEFGTDIIISELGRCYSEAQADIVLSTAHKAKGREWGKVQLAGDFPDPEERDVSDEDVRLLYVAATRAKVQLDVSSVGFYKEEPEA